MYWLAVILVVALLAFMVWASAYIGSGVYVKALCRGEADNAQKSVAITFDDGPDAEMTPRVLDVLRRHDVKAAFFVIGEKVRRNPQIVERMVGEGHIVANHTRSHRFDFPLSSYENVVREIGECSDAVEAAIGRRPKLFRPPFGVTNPSIGRTVRFLGLQCIGWSIRSLDTVSRRSRADVLERITERVHDGAVILLHDRCPGADMLLDALIVRIRERGYGIKRVDELLKTEAYEA